MGSSHGANEVKYLVSKGIQYGENGISHTTSKHSGISYYLCQNQHNMEILNEYRKNIVSKNN